MPTTVLEWIKYGQKFSDFRKFYKYWWNIDIIQRYLRYMVKGI